MSPAHIVPFVVVGVLLVLRLTGRLPSLRGRARSSDRPASALPRSVRAPLLGNTGLVAGREVRERIRGRVFRVGTLLVLAGVAAAIVIPVVNRGKTGPERVGVVGTLAGQLRAGIASGAKAIGTTVTLLPEANLDEARADLGSGRIQIAVTNTGGLVVNKAIASTNTSTTARLVRALTTTLGVDEAVAAAGLSAAQAAALAAAKPLPVTSLHPLPTSRPQRATSQIGLVLVFVMLTQYNTWTLVGVMEEKSSRVVEVLLAAVRPIELLAGKVLGIGLVALGQAALIVAFAFGLAEAVGSDLLHGTAPLLLLSTLVWLVLGYAFYCWVYAAAGAMAERQDQVQSLVFPLSLPVIFGYVISLATAGSQSPSTFFKVLAYLPPTAPFAMPTLVGLGGATWWEFVAACGLSIAGTVGVAKLAAGIYRRAILRTGRRVPLRELFSRVAG